MTEGTAPLKKREEQVKRDANGRFERGSKPLPHAHRPKGSLNVYLFTKPGVDGTQRKTLGAWPRFKEKDARAAAKIATGDLVRTGDPNAAKREAKQQQQLAGLRCISSNRRFWDAEELRLFAGGRRQGGLRAAAIELHQ